MEIHGYTIQYYLRHDYYEKIDGYVNPYPGIRIAVINGKVVYAHINLAAMYAKPWKILRSRSIDEALKILKATLDIGGVLSNARGWSPDKDARLLASPHPIDFTSATINKILITLIGTYDVPLRPGEEKNCHYSYLIPVYVFEGLTDRGENFHALVDAVNRK